MLFSTPLWSLFTPTLGKENSWFYNRGMAIFAFTESSTFVTPVKKPTEWKPLLQGAVIGGYTREWPSPHFMAKNTCVGLQTALSQCQSACTTIWMLNGEVSAAAGPLRVFLGSKTAPQVWRGWQVSLGFGNQFAYCYIWRCLKLESLSRGHKTVAGAKQSGCGLFFL